MLSDSGCQGTDYANMNTSAQDNDSPGEPEDRGSRLRTELIIGSVWLAVGLFLVPAVVYLVGIKLLGPYGNNGAGMSTFYGAFFADLASGAPRTWILALGPLLMISIVRLLYIGVGAKRQADQDESRDDAPPPRQAPPPPVKERRRIEPRVS
jgi:hypothetical protein